MSVYNSNIQTRLIDPVFDRKNFRAEYRLNAEIDSLIVLLLMLVLYLSFSKNIQLWTNVQL